MKNLVTASLLVFATASALSPLYSQSSPTSPTIDHPEAYLRAAYYNENDDILSRDGKALASSKGASLETRAWYAQSVAREPEGFALLDAMQTEKPDDPWTLVVHAYATGDAAFSATLCEQAFAKSTSPDIAVLCARAVSSQVTDKSAAPQLREFFEHNKARYEASPDTLTAEASALYRSSFFGDKAATDDASALLDRALASDPHNVRAILFKANLLSRKKQYKEELALLEGAKSWAGVSGTWHSMWYGALDKTEELKKPERQKEVEQDAHALLDKGEPGTTLLVAEHDLLEAGDKKAATDLQNAIVQKFPNTPAAAEAELQRATAKLNADASIEKATPAARAELEKTVLSVLQRYGASDRMVEIRCASALTQIYEQDRPTAAQLLAAAKATSWRMGDNFATPLMLRGEHSDELAQLAQQRINEMLRLATNRSKGWHYESAADDMRSYWSQLGTWYGILGAAQLNEAKLKDAGENLQSAETMLQQQAGKEEPTTFLDYSPELLAEFGRYYTETGDYPKADQYLARSLSAEYYGKDEHPSIAAYKALYLKQHNGSNQGLEAYMAKAYEIDRQHRKAQVLKSRLPQPKPAEPFAKLALLGTKQTVSLDDLKNKYVVINFWGTWCGPCKGEMPEVQKFYDKYKDDPKVVFLTVDEGDTADQVSKFLADKKYTLPVLMQTEYTRKADVNAFPTTWFIDPNGRIDYEKIGSSQRLVEEFTWRLESMMQPN
ncbi:MAG TPA: redoxin domain-containing protein [Candidatus Koribacter sp.]|jgi:thiol-disulfide isomerase/thioredoxin